jgi:hypothetical protein
MKSLNTRYMQTAPYAQQVSDRINDLIIYYGRAEVRSEWFTGKLPQNPELERHVDNLTDTFGMSLVGEYMELILKPVKKAG